MLTMVSITGDRQRESGRNVMIHKKPKHAIKRALNLLRESSRKSLREINISGLFDGLCCGSDNAELSDLDYCRDQVKDALQRSTLDLDRKLKSALQDVIAAIDDHMIAKGHK